MLLDSAAPAIGRTLIDLALRKETGAIVFALERDGAPIQAASRICRSDRGT